MRFPFVSRSGRTALVLVMVAGMASACRADVTPHRLFTDNMVLQRDRVTPIRGRARL